MLELILDDGLINYYNLFQFFDNFSVAISRTYTLIKKAIGKKSTNYFFVNKKENRRTLKVSEVKLVL